MNAKQTVDSMSLIGFLALVGGGLTGSIPICLLGLGIILSGVAWAIASIADKK